MTDWIDESPAVVEREEHIPDAGAKRVVIRYFNSADGEWYNWVPPGGGSSSATTQVGDSATVVTLKAANSARVKLVIANTSTAILYVKEGSTATASDWSYRLEQYDVAIIDDYDGVVTGIWSADSGGFANVTETS